MKVTRMYGFKIYKQLVLITCLYRFIKILNLEYSLLGKKTGGDQAHFIRYFLYR